MPLDSAIYAAGVVLPGPSSLPASTQMPSWTVAGAFAGWVSATSPAGVGTELQFKNGAVFGAVTGSSASGSGHVYIGTASSVSDQGNWAAFLQIADANFAALSVRAAGANRQMDIVQRNSFHLYDPIGSAYRLTILSTGLVGINTGESIGAQLHILSSAPTTVGQIIAGAPNQSATLFQLNHGSNPGTNANYLSCTSSGGVEGDTFKVDSGGNVSNSGGYYKSYLAHFGAYGAACGIGANADFGNYGTVFRNNAIGLTATHNIVWTSGNQEASQDTFLRRAAAATLQLGLNAASAIHQTFKAHDGVGLNIVAANLYIAPGKSTGSGAPTSVVIQGTVAGASSSTVQALVDVARFTPGFIDYTATTADCTVKLKNSSSISGGLIYQLEGSQTAYLWNYEAGSFYFGTSGLARMVIHTTGLVGINKSSSIAAQLHIVQSGTTIPGLQVDGITSHSVPLFKLNMGATPTGNVIDVFTSAAASVFSVNTIGGIRATSLKSVSDNLIIAATGNNVIYIGTNGADTTFEIQLNSPIGVYANMSIYQGMNIVLATTTGTKLATAANQLLGIWGATPVVQPTAVADATDALSVITQLNALLSRIRTIGLIAA